LDNQCILNIILIIGKKETHFRLVELKIKKAGMSGIFTLLTTLTELLYIDFPVGEFGDDEKP